MQKYYIVKYLPYVTFGLATLLETHAGIEFVQINFPRTEDPRTVDIYYSGMDNDQVELVSVIFSGE